jgi:hypothetical protein
VSSPAVPLFGLAFTDTVTAMPLAGSLQLRFQPGPVAATPAVRVTGIHLVHAPFLVGGHTVEILAEEFVFQDFRYDPTLSESNVQGPYTLRYEFRIDGIGPVAVYEPGRFAANFNASTGVWSDIAFGGPFEITATVCDPNMDGVIDQTDINGIFTSRGAAARAGDPRDADGDGVVTPNDARICVLKCARPLCAP